ncbi:hypothetical protein [Clostridium sp.]|uniref:hypothetical protein n=1 Tax=Clostridium sp. TaxID=1506 RepID=UPI003F325C69
MNRIGVFFYVEGKIISEQYKLQEGMQQGVFISPPEGHDRVWRRAHGDTTQKSYDFWPRGRVAYNTNSKQFVMYHDECLEQFTLNQIREIFEISSEQVRYVKDEYYTCHQCIKKFEDMDDESMYYSF